MRAAVDAIAKAETIYVAGFRRAFPIAAYLAYSLQQLNKHVLFIDGIGWPNGQDLGPDTVVSEMRVIGDAAARWN